MNMLFNPKRVNEAIASFGIQDHFTAEVLSMHFNDSETGEIKSLGNYNPMALEVKRLIRNNSIQPLFVVHPYPGAPIHIVSVQLSGHYVVAVQVDGVDFVGYLSDALFSVLE